MVADIRAQLVDALADHMMHEISCLCGEDDFTFADDWGRHVADALLSLPGVAIVQLPAYNEEYECFIGGGYPCNGDPEHVAGVPGGMVRAGIGKYMSPRAAREAAAALLAAANAAERGDDGG